MQIRFAFNSDLPELVKMSGEELEYFQEFMKTGYILLAKDSYLMYNSMQTGCRIQKLYGENKKELIHYLEKVTITQGNWFIEMTIPEEDLETALLLKDLHYIGKQAGKHYLFQKTI